ncbi:MULTISPECIES: helix-turn-helix domain-containing protein [unclassified Clostridioides]|uniref:helix-turn-helix domain-containing protein n=1 Tax=unclassified Clostridioides TaxID=2635829 RepID=UPI001D0F6E9C|nr:helix-turn-helix domain-containing protein [Clostridioides sp. ES-W-0018-02]MCC0681103.1 helix-turn-helix domain-containing protein [Clostridioides sp. ES-S-0005-03]MCC0712791.1 helix-turn-helix domain-containing protein [Clostridioides sp. ES-W-0017-02]UDN47300.1 helix-turn-helix domain-containing protein [Clostridioides sp. ES-S-0173-01]
MLKELRKKKKLTQTELAKRVGCHRSQISRLENNEDKDLTIPILIELEIALELDEKYLVNYFADEYIKKRKLYK